MFRRAIRMEPAKDEDCLFDTLGVNRQANDDEIKERYKALYGKSDDDTRKQLNRAKLILLDPQLKKDYIAKLVREGKKDGMIETGTGLEEVHQPAGEKIAIKVTLDKKAKAVICFDFETLKNNIAKSFGVDIKSIFLGSVPSYGIKGFEGESYSIDKFMT